MAVLDVIVDKFMFLWRIYVVRRYFPWLFLLISILGSFLKDAQLIPKTYFSNTKNVFNVYFVKVCWGWTLLLLTPFLLLSNSSFSRSLSFLIKRCLALVVATVVWYVCTETFFYIEDLTGSCIETDTVDVIRKEFTWKASCRAAGFDWHGYDISGHSFILAYSVLFILEETALMTNLKTASLSTLQRVALNVLYVALNLLVMLWIWMFMCTSVYFHDFSHKFLGTSCALLAWYMTYRVWYLKPLSPGLPPQRQPKEQKQRA